MNIQIPKKVKDKEIFLCNEVAKKLKKNGLSKEQKYNLVEAYLKLEYLNNIKYGNLSQEKEQLQNEIENVTSSSLINEKADKILDNKINNTINNLNPILSLNKIYRLYKTSLKFSKRINSFKKELENANSDEKKEQIIEKYLLEDLKFVFDITKIELPIYYQVYYAMQVIVWENVIAGGLVCGYNLSAELLQKSLISSSKKIEDYYVTSIDRKKEIANNKVVKSKIKELINKYSNNIFIKIDEKVVNSEELLISFRSKDLYYSFHNATINIEGNKNENNKWQLKVLLKDKYDFTDPNLKRKEYKDSLLGSILNNCGVVSQQYGVIRPYNVYIELNYDGFEVNSIEE